MPKGKNFVIEGYDGISLTPTLWKIVAPNDGDAVLMFEKRYPFLTVGAVYTEV